MVDSHQRARQTALRFVERRAGIAADLWIGACRWLEPERVRSVLSAAIRRVSIEGKAAWRQGIGIKHSAGICGLDATRFALWEHAPDAPPNLVVLRQHKGLFWPARLSSIRPLWCNTHNFR